MNLRVRPRRQFLPGNQTPTKHTMPKLGASPRKTDGNSLAEVVVRAVVLMVTVVATTLEPSIVKVLLAIWQFASLGAPVQVNETG